MSQTTLPEGCTILSSQAVEKMERFDYIGPGLEFIVATPRGQRRVVLAMTDPEDPETIRHLRVALEVMRDAEDQRALREAGR